MTTEKKEKKKKETKVETVTPEQTNISLPEPTQALSIRKVHTDEGGEMVYSLMEREDENQITQEIKGVIPVDVMVYEFPDKKTGRNVTGLSYVGVKEVVRTMNARNMSRIRISPQFPPKIEETDDAVTVHVYAEDMVNGGAYWGIKRQAKFYKEGYPNPFALEQALSKAQRNALQPLIPATFVIEMIKDFRARGQVKTLTATPTNTQPKLEAPPIKQPMPEPTQPKEAITAELTPATPPANPDDAKITKENLRYLFAKCKEKPLNLEAQDVKRLAMGLCNVESRADLTVKQMNLIISKLELVKAGKAELSYTQDGSKILIKEK